MEEARRGMKEKEDKILKRIWNYKAKGGDLWDVLVNDGVVHAEDWYRKSSSLILAGRRKRIRSYKIPCVVRINVKRGGVKVFARLSSIERRSN